MNDRAPGPRPWSAEGGRRSVLVARVTSSLPARVFRRMIEIGGYDRAVALAAQAFMSLLPMLLVLGALLPADARGPAGGAVVSVLGLSGSAATALTDVVDPGRQVLTPAEPLTLVSAVLLVVSVLGFARSLQRTHLAAWELPARGIRGYGYGVIAAAALVAEFAAIALIGPALARVAGGVTLGIVGHALVATLVWWPVQRLLVGGRIGWRALLPGSAVTGLGQGLVVAVSGVYLPVSAAHEAARYGAVGVAVAFVSWLVVLGLLLVVAAVVGAELARPDSRLDGR